MQWTGPRTRAEQITKRRILNGWHGCCHVRDLNKCRRKLVIEGDSPKKTKNMNLYHPKWHSRTKPHFQEDIILSLDPQSWQSAAGNWVWKEVKSNGYIQSIKGLKWKQHIRTTLETISTNQSKASSLFLLPSRKSFVHRTLLYNLPSFNPNKQADKPTKSKREQNKPNPSFSLLSW